MTFVSTTALEYSPVEYRNFFGMLIEVPFAFGEAFIALFAYFIRDWRWLQGSCAIPMLFIIAFYW